MIDIVPTILDATGIQAPATVNGIAQKPIEGVSTVYTFDQANAKVPSKRDAQYFEMFANRGIYHDGWYAATPPPSWAIFPYARTGDQAFLRSGKPGD
jgi:arylsulfatase A-like enzyme